MALDLKNLKPTTVSKDLKGKFVFLYGPAKIGKTSLAVQFPRNLLLAVEHGYNAIDDAYAVDVPTWGEFKKYVKQLQDDQVKELYDTVTVDTVSLLYERCEAYICDREGVEKIGDIPFGAGYKMVDREFEDALRKITQIVDKNGRTAYGLCLIGHEKVRVDSDGQTSVKHITPDASDRCAKIINRMVDLTAYIGMEDGVRYIYPRQTTIEEGKQITDIYAGSHFAGLNDKIELSYEALVEAIANAMTVGVKGEKIVLTDEPINIQPMQEGIDFKAVRANIGKIAKKLATLDEGADPPHFVDDYRVIVESYLGKDKYVKDCTASQSEHLQGILEELQMYLEKNNISID